MGYKVDFTEVGTPIIEKDALGEIFPTPQAYKEFAKQCLFDINFDEKLENLRID